MTANNDSTLEFDGSVRKYGIPANGLKSLDVKIAYRLTRVISLDNNQLLFGTTAIILKQ
jgi:hypothetical protein